MFVGMSFQWDAQADESSEDTDRAGRVESIDQVGKASRIPKAAKTTI